MSAMNSQAAAVRRAPAPAAAARPQRATYTLPGDSDLDQSLKLNLSDLQVPVNQGLDIEGFKPSLLSRILDIFTRR